MSHARIEDDLPEHPKWAPLTDAAFRLGIRSICWCRKPDRQRRRPGFVPASMLVTLARRSPAAAARLAEELTKAGREMHDHGIWEPVEGGWMIHDFQQYGEPTIAPTLSKSEAGRMGGRASAAAREANSGTARPAVLAPAGASPKQSAAASEAAPEAAPEANSPASPEATRSTSESTCQISAEDPVFPDPDPDPDPDPPVVPQQPGAEATLNGTAAERGAVRRTFEAWKLDTGHHRAVLDRKRGRRILSRLREGFTPERMSVAIQNRRNDLFLMGKNDSGRVYDDIDTLLRDAAQVERLERLTEPLRPSGPRAAGRGPVQVGGENPFDKAVNLE